MGKIHVLSEYVVSHIAAGEVIERPCFAVKELIENAIDAKANSIHIEIEESGLKKIVVSDNGEGMDPHDLELSIQPHTTSKIKTEHDLNSVQTLGFRGEALSSIAAISNMKIKSRTVESASGTQIELKSGKIISVSPVGMPVGTTITVERLFYPVPARKKFLKSERTEFRLIVEVVSHLAAAYPDVQFFLSHNGRTVLDFQKDISFQKRLTMVLGESELSNLIPIQQEGSYVSIFGYISRPQITSKNFSKHVIIINKRYVTDSTISRLVKQAYGNLLDPHSYPVFLMHITAPSQIVDVNIHPRKEQVGFTDTQVLYDLIQKAITNALYKHNLTFEYVVHDEPRATQTFTGLLLKDEVSPWQLSDVNKEPVQLHNLYIIVQTKRGVLFIDQHAAHERILYEQFKEAFEKKQTEQKKYPLKKAVSIELTPTDREVLLEYMDMFEQIGFTIEEFGGNAFLLREVPYLFQGRNYKNLLVELLENLSQEHTSTRIDFYSDKILKYLACRAAVKAGDPLSASECRELLKKLEITPNNITCPHGRPTKVEMPLSEFHKMFKR